MAKTLWLLRHAHARENPPAGGRDRDRRLSARGQFEASALGEELKSSERTLPTLVVVSPAARTKETCSRVFGDLGGKGEVVVDQDLYRATPDDVVDMVRRFPDDVAIAGVVGHNPTIHCLSLDLLAEVLFEQSHPGSSHYPPGTISVLSFPISTWGQLGWGEATLEWFRVPQKDERTAEKFL